MGPKSTNADRQRDRGVLDFGERRLRFKWHSVHARATVLHDKSGVLAAKERHGEANYIVVTIT